MPLVVRSSLSVCGVVKEACQCISQTPTKHFEKLHKAAQTVHLDFHGNWPFRMCVSCTCFATSVTLYITVPTTQSVSAVCVVVWRAAGMIAQRACESHDKYAFLRVSAAMQCCSARTCVHGVEFQHTHIHAQNNLWQKLFKVLPSSWWSSACTYSCAPVSWYCKSSVLLEVSVLHMLRIRSRVCKS